MTHAADVVEENLNKNSAAESAAELKEIKVTLSEKCTNFKVLTFYSHLLLQQGVFVHILLM